MEMSSSLIPALGAIAAALVAGTFSFISLMVAKDHKTSEYRQNWIDVIREDIAEYISLFAAITSFEAMAYKKSEEDGKTYVESHQEQWIKFLSLDSRIALRLNPVEHIKLIDLLEEATALASDSKSDARTEDKINELTTSITSESQKILKNEWKRVKRGEISFFITKWTALLISVIAIYWIYLLKDKIYIDDTSSTTVSCGCNDSVHRHQ